LVFVLAVQRSDRFTQYIQIRLRVSFGDGFRTMSQQVPDVFDLHSRSAETGSKRVAEIVPSEVFDFCFREDLVEHLREDFSSRPSDPVRTGRGLRTTAPVPSPRSRNFLNAASAVSFIGTMYAAAYYD
jgi:bifunctional DNase/RNase